MEGCVGVEGVEWRGEGGVATAEGLPTAVSAVADEDSFTDCSSVVLRSSRRASCPTAVRL